MKNTKILKYGFIAYCIMLVCQLLLKFVTNFNEYQFQFEHWGYADWLINFEGGFVRRGILGQVLLCMYRWFNIDIGQTLHIVSLLTTLALIALVIALFIRKKWSALILPTVIMLGTFAINDIASFRRDQLMLLILFLIFYFYRKCITGNNKVINYLLFSITAIFVILVHEASFFCFVPFIFIHQCGKLHIKNALKSALFLLPVIAAMGVCCIFKGDATTADAIWESYQPYFIETYGNKLPMGEAVNALTWKTIPTMSEHLWLNYRYPCFIGWIIAFVTTFYLCANVNRVKLFSYEKKETNSVSLTSILLAQFISLLPMFTVLSCDLGRITIYWTFTSFFIYALFGDTMEIPLLTGLSKRINNVFNTTWLSSKRLYVFMIITVGCPLIFYTANQAYNTTTIGNICRFTEMLYKIISFHL